MFSVLSIVLSNYYKSLLRKETAIFINV